MYESFEKLSEEKQAFILNTSMDHFTKYGYLLANTVDIARDCAIAKGSLFHYFKNKKELFLYVVRHGTKRIMDATAETLSQITGDDYFDRVRQSVLIKAALPIQYPRETALLARVFSDRAHEAAMELQTMVMEYSTTIKELNARYIGCISPELIKDGISLKEADHYIQIVFEGITAGILRRHAKNPQALLDNPELITEELERAIKFIKYGVGK